MNGHPQKDQILRCSFLPDTHDNDRNHRARPRYFHFMKNGVLSCSVVHLVLDRAEHRTHRSECWSRLQLSAQSLAKVDRLFGKSLNSKYDFFTILLLYFKNKDSRARVDVHKRDGHGTDKVATIYGAPEACGVAANRILDIIRKEERDDDLPLKLLAHNALIGRLIGRDGRNLKQIQVQAFELVDPKRSFQEKTGAKIAISSMHDVSPYNLDRTISISGSLKEIADAEQLITEKLRQFEV